MGVIPDRQDFLRRLTQSGAYTEMQASVLADALDATVGQPASKVDLLETRGELKQDIGDLRSELKDVRAELKQDIGDLRSELKDVRAELKQDIGDLRAELKQGIGDLRAELKQGIGDLRAELKQDIGDLRSELKDVRAELKQESVERRADVRVLTERIERVADRTLIRVAAVLVVVLTAFFGGAFKLATITWPPPG